MPPPLSLQEERIENILQKVKPKTRQLHAQVPVLILYEVRFQESGAQKASKLGTQNTGQFQSGGHNRNSQDN